MKPDTSKNPGPSTACVHGGSTSDHRMVTVPKTMPIYESSVFTYNNLAEVDDFLAGNPDNYMYTRLGNPNQRALEDWIIPLEGAEAACTAGSGMAALMAAIGAICNHGDTIALARDIYGGTQSLVEKEFARWGLKSLLVDTTELAQGTIELPPQTKVLVVETASNPLVRVADIPTLAELAHGAGAKLLVDNTFLSPLLFKPLAHGADLVIHSTTKYINGHSDATGGIMAGPKDWISQCRRVIANTGGLLSPFEAWLTQRGAKTLGLRMKAHSENALELAAWLEGVPGVDRVYYPGLPSHPDHKLATKLFPRGMGGMMSFDLRGGLDAADNLIQKLSMIKFAPSLAGVSTTISHPGKTSHRGHSPESLAQLGISQGTIRLSVGIEDIQDIKADLLSAISP